VTNAATRNFFDEWAIYDQILAHNYMHHDDIFRDVECFLATVLETRRFRFSILVAAALTM
jgi:hypothetical protein